MTKMKRQAARRQHRSRKLQVKHQAAQLLHRLLDILHRDQAHRIEPRVDFPVALRNIIVEGVTDSHGVVRLLEKSYRKSFGRKQHRL